MGAGRRPGCSAYFLHRSQLYMLSPATQEQSRGWQVGHGGKEAEPQRCWGCAPGIPEEKGICPWNTETLYRHLQKQH